jgi:hypothetical protein
MRGAKARKNLSGRTKILVRTGARPQSRRTDNTGNMGISTRFQGAHLGANLGANLGAQVRTPRFAPRSAHARNVDAAAPGALSRGRPSCLELCSQVETRPSNDPFGICAMRSRTQAGQIVLIPTAIVAFVFTNQPNRHPWPPQAVARVDTS